jgi:poly(3-hydroxybutyrate) depolymerase
VKRILSSALALVVGAALGAQIPDLHKQRVTFPHGSLTLVGFLFRPAGAGPFPAIIWNHGSEKNPGTGPEFDAVAAAFVPAGFVVFAPMRRGHGLSEDESLAMRLRASAWRAGRPAQTA